jgi:putative (di)nucleoside polyphosphate hydrolase
MNTTRLPTDAEIRALPYRPCVGLLVLNSGGRIFAGQRLDGSSEAWQMPQGGIDPGETVLQAALRELAEETGITREKAEILRESAHWLNYDVPRHLVPRLWGGQFRGQTQRWVALRFTGTDADVDIETSEPEFRCWAWMDPERLIDSIVPFKRDTYALVLAEFRDLL